MLAVSDWDAAWVMSKDTCKMSKAFHLEECLVTTLPNRCHLANTTYILLSQRVFHSTELSIFACSGRRGSQMASKKITVAISDCPHIPSHKLYQLIRDESSRGWASELTAKEGIFTIWFCLDEADGAHWQHQMSVCVTALQLCAVWHSLCLWLSPRCENSSWLTGVCTWVWRAALGPAPVDVNLFINFPDWWWLTLLLKSSL